MTARRPHRLDLVVDAARLVIEHVERSRAADAAPDLRTLHDAPAATPAATSGEFTRVPVWRIGDRVLAPGRVLAAGEWVDGGPGEIVGFRGGVDADGIGRGRALVCLDDMADVAFEFEQAALRPAPTV